MKGLIIDISWDVKDKRFEFIPIDAITSIRKTLDGFEVMYGCGGFTLSRKDIDIDELVIKDYSEYLNLYKK